MRFGAKFCFSVEDPFKIWISFRHFFHQQRLCILAPKSPNPLKCQLPPFHTTLLLKMLYFKAISTIWEEGRNCTNCFTFSICSVQFEEKNGVSHPRPLWLWLLCTSNGRQAMVFKRGSSEKECGLILLHRTNHQHRCPAKYPCYWQKDQLEMMDYVVKACSDIVDWCIEAWIGEIKRTFWRGDQPVWRK